MHDVLFCTLKYLYSFIHLGEVAFQYFYVQACNSIGYIYYRFSFTSLYVAKMNTTEEF